MLRRASRVLLCVPTVSLRELKGIALARAYAEARPTDAAAQMAARHTLLVDVRRDDEVRATGLVPTAAHVPMHDLQEVLSERDDAVFQEQGFDGAPDPAAHRLVFYCAAGVRSAAAVQLAEGIGYRGAAHYRGGMEQYAQDPITDADIEAYLVQQDRLRANTAPASEPGSTGTAASSQRAEQ